MKKRREVIVPLSDLAVEVIKEAISGDDQTVVFPSKFSDGESRGLALQLAEFNEVGSVGCQFSQDLVAEPRLRVSHASKGLLEVGIVLALDLPAICLELRAQRPELSPLTRRSVRCTQRVRQLRNAIVKIFDFALALSILSSVSAAAAPRVKIPGSCVAKLRSTKSRL
ncbi:MULTISPECIES: hypothetical protein [unclassified Bradyrhizobium]|uniref:hypothetical protein n=1 Tax=unclassified Bradyrhizobium TaxID=2631580 RepID=UPI001FFC0414|nr:MULTISPECIES: hypothetical protein [unclassified Bradyrhizobium]